MFKNKNQAICSVELAFSQFMAKSPKQKNMEVRRILSDHWSTSQSYERLLICLNCICSYLFKTNKMDNQCQDLLKANINFWKVHQKDIHDSLQKIIQMMKKNGKQQKRNYIQRMIGKESITSYSHSETVSTVKKSISSRTDDESFITLDQYQNEVKVLKQIIKQLESNLQVQKNKNEELMERISSYENKLQDYERRVIRMKKSIMAIKQEILEIKSQQKQLIICTKTTKQKQARNNILNMEQLKSAISKYNAEVSNKIIQKYKQKEKEKEKEKEKQRQRQKQRQNNGKIIEQIKNISQESMINWQSNKQSSNNVISLIKQKIIMINCSYLQSILHCIKYGNTDKGNQRGVDTRAKSVLTLTQLQQQIVDRVVSLQKQNQDLHAKIKVKQDEKVSNRSIIAKQPTLSFMWSHILPILNTNSQQLAAQAYKQQQYIIKIVQNYYKNSKSIQFMKLLYSLKELSGISSFHTFVDDYPNLLLLVRLKNGTIIGAYSEAGLSKQSSAHNRSTGFLFQCKNNKIFLQRQKFRNGPIMPYNEYHIIVGNHDIKIFQDKNYIESYFGKQNSMFRPSSEYSTNDLLFEGQAEKCEINDIEFYSIFFK